jgi:hypothetical protein
MDRIQDYHFGSVSVDGQRHTHDLIVYPDRVQADWWRKEGHRLRVEDLPDVLADPPEVLIVGRGASAQMVVDPEVEQELERRGINIIAEPTESACERFNELSKEGRRVVVALHLTC